MECLKLILKNMFNTQIRLGAKGYLIWNLFVLGSIIVGGILIYSVGTVLFYIKTGIDTEENMYLIMNLISVIFIVPNIILTIDRLHDLGFSGWWIVLLLIPIVGLIFAVFLLFFPSKKENNKYENLPKIC